MTNRKFLTVAASLLVLGSMNVFAQKSEYNSNWFIGGGAGVNTFFSINGKNGFDSKYMPSGDVYFGKWYTPKFGVKFGVQGGQYSTNGSSQNMDHLDALYGHGDFIWAPTKWLNPYAHAGIMSGLIRPGRSMQNEVAAGVGTVLRANLTDKFGIYSDFRFTLMPERVANVPLSRFTGILAANAGLMYNFDGDFKNPSTTRLTGFLFDDMFLQVGGGVNTLNSFNGYGFSGRITPATQIAVGKWLTNTFAVRGGIQGLTFSHWGKEAPESTIIGSGIYHGEELDKEKFGFTYLNLSLLWDINSMINGYRSTRTWTVLPYLHGGYINNISINSDRWYLTNNEWTAGAGILNQIRVRDEMGIYFDARAFAMNHIITGNPKDSYTMAFTALAGVYYDLGTQFVRFHGADEKTAQVKEPTDRTLYINGPHYGPYIYNGIWDNWFLGVQGGVASAVTFKTGAGFNGRVTPSADVFVGKWFSPEFGMRAGVQAPSLSFYGNKPDGTVSAVVSEKESKPLYKETATYGYVHGDLLWNALNTFKGYKEERPVELIPYATAGLYGSITPDRFHIYQRNFAAGAGAVISVAVNDLVKFNTDVRAIALKARALGDLEGGYALALSGNMGFSVDLGKNYWGPGEGVLLNNFWDNWFVQAAGGIQTAGFKAEDFTWNGRITPSEEIMLGKWFSPSVGVRAGVQGTAIMTRGYEPSADVWFGDGYRDGKEISYEKFNARYSHADMMWNVLNSFNYDENRNFDIIPYAHFGIYNNSTANTNSSKSFTSEFATGLGLMVSRDLDRKVSLYADVRGTAMKRQMFGDKDAKLAGGASASLGLTYNLGSSKGSEYDSNDWRHLPEGRFEEELPARRWAVSTNLVDLADYGTLNLGVQRVISRHITTDMQGKLNLWSFNEKSSFDQKQSISLGARYWPWYTYSGVWFRGFAQVEDYATSDLRGILTLGRSAKAEKGAAYGAGVGLGYSLMLRRNLNLDFGFSGWAGMTDYTEFTNRKFATPIAQGKKFFIAPSDVHFSVMFIF